MAFQIPMGELVKELTTMRKDAEVWDPDGQIEWDITVYIISLEEGFTWDPSNKKFFLNKNKGIKIRDSINEKFDSNPAKLLKVVVKLNRKDISVLEDEKIRKDNKHEDKK